ncbi:putative amidase [Cocos nucifera]|uniref:Putative amidase n=1 Tax=Cocos nucifera TaxID=13894 RepID=A0A8K0N480_COCNU|nr:putative amidase [Cocos nucifera]
MAILTPSLLSPLFVVLLASTNSRGFEIKEATIDGIQQAFKEGSLTSRRLVEHYLDQIQTLNPLLHAVIEVNPDAVPQADRADEERLSGRHPGGGLHGIPILLKDNIATLDRLNTTVGSLALLGSVVPRDAGVVRRLRQAGAVILGKASLGEWGNFRSHRIPSAWSARGGQGRNPYVLSKYPCGSSTGSAIAVAANMVSVTLGTETDGSIICAAAHDSVVGIKPTVGLTSRAGVIPISPTMDTVGGSCCILRSKEGFTFLHAHPLLDHALHRSQIAPYSIIDPPAKISKQAVVDSMVGGYGGGRPLCRTVSDSVHVLEAIVGYDSRDADATLAASSYIPQGGYRQFLKLEGLKGKRLGILRKGFFEFPKGSINEEVFEEHFNTMRNVGAILIDNLEINNAIIIRDAKKSGENALMLAEFKLYLNAYLSELSYSPVRSLADVIAFNDEHSVEERMAEFGQSILLEAQNTSGIGPVERSAIAKMTRLSLEGLERLMMEKKLDAIVTPGASATGVLAIGGYPELSYSPVRSLADVIAFNDEHSVEERMAEFGQSILLEAQNTSGIGPVERSAIAKMTRLSLEGLERLMMEKKLDAIVTPGASATGVLAIGGYPGISVPAGYGTNGVPFGICFGGLKGSEPELIEIAYAFEQATTIRKPPSFKPGTSAFQPLKEW